MVEVVQRLLLCLPVERRVTSPNVFSSGQKNQYIVTTVLDSPAEKAGVNTGDRLIWINGDKASMLTYSAISRTVSPVSLV